MSIPKIIEELTSGKVYHLYYNDENKLVPRDRHVLIIVLEAGENRKHLCAITLAEFEKYKCNEYNIPSKAEVFMGEDAIGVVSKTELKHGKGLRISKFFSVEVDGKPQKMQMGGSAYSSCMDRVENLFDDLAECVRVNPKCNGTKSKLICFDDEDIVGSEGLTTLSRTYLRYHGCTSDYPVSFITWEGDDYKKLMDDSIVLFEDLPEPMNTGEHEVEEEKPGGFIGFLKRLFSRFF
jgi:hypothetical protein